MVRTWEAIKLEVDAAHPTPTPIWFLHTDNPDHMHDDRALTRAEVQFDGTTYVVEGHILRADNQVGWNGRLVVGEEVMRMVAINQSFSTWVSCADGIMRGLDIAFQKIRNRMTTEILAKEQLTEAGITAHAPSTLIKLDSLTIGTEGERVIAVASFRTGRPFLHGHHVKEPNHDFSSHRARRDSDAGILLEVERQGFYS